MPKLTKINISEKIVTLEDKELSLALSANKEFGITLKGEIKYAPFEPYDIFIYQGTVAPEQLASKGSVSSKFKKALGKNYQVIEKGDKIQIKVEDAWQDIINYNIQNCHFNDTSGEGIDEFSTKEIEDMGWMIIDFDVTYTEIFEFLQNSTDITLLCKETKEPYFFSAMGYFDNLKQTQEVLYTFCQKVIKDKLANDPDFTYEYLDEDQKEAVSFFKAR